jgi:chorismate mutase-like protein
MAKSPESAPESADLKSLDDLRAQIDEIDSQIHDLLMRRTEITAEVGRAKKRAQAQEVQFLRPGREAEVLRRLVARHQGDFPRVVLVHIWREIFAAATSQQGDFSVSVDVSGEAAGQAEALRMLARDHFGSYVKLSEQGSAQRVITTVAEGDAQVGVLPLPESGQDAWWTILASGEEKMPRIVARLPFASLDRNGPEAVAVGRSRQEETGSDRSYLILESESDLSRAGVSSMLEKAGLTAVTIEDGRGRGGGALVLVEVEGFVGEEDVRLDRLGAAATGGPLTVWRAGGYAAPLSPEELTP